MSQVFVVDTNTQPLDQVHAGRVLLLLSSGRATVWRRFSFTIMLKQAGEQPRVRVPRLRLKLDLGSQVKGVTVVNEVSGEVVFAAKLSHRGGQIKAASAYGYEVLQYMLEKWGSRYNRLTRKLGNAHWIDAACVVGRSILQTIDVRESAPFLIVAKGHGGRQMCRTNKRGFPRTGPKRVKDFQTGDTVRAVVSAGKKMGAYVWRVAVNASGLFNIATAHRIVQSISYRFCAVFHRCDGYKYGRGNAVL